MKRYEYKAVDYRDKDTGKVLTQGVPTTLFNEDGAAGWLLVHTDGISCALFAREIPPAPVAWSSEPPTQEGYYWLTTPVAKEPRLTEVKMIGGRLVAYGGAIHGELSVQHIRDDARWLGPLEVPAP